jgi:GrpB-like predicted nucleotidyltransferase (UPF0157 family)
MKMQLDQMTNEELGKLFPIIILESNPDWIKLFQLEKNVIEKVFGKNDIVRIEHIGSTAIPDLKSKPTIDILLEVPESLDNDIIINRLIKLKYQFIPKPENPAPHMMFVKGYTTTGFQGQAYHIHVRYNGDWDEIYFRDYLKQNPSIAKEYGELKMLLAREYGNDRDLYTDKKSDFVRRITEIAHQKK